MLIFGSDLEEMDELLFDLTGGVSGNGLLKTGSGYPRTGDLSFRRWHSHEFTILDNEHGTLRCVLNVNVERWRLILPVDVLVTFLESL